MSDCKILPLACVALALSACVFEGRQPAPTYVLSNPTWSRSEQSSAYHIKIVMPEVAPGLGTRQIAVIDQTSRLDYVADGEWPEPLPVMLQNVWLESLRQSGLVASVSSDQTAVRADRLLQLSVPEFNFVRAGDVVTAKVRYEAKLLEPASRKVLAIRQFEASDTVPSGPFAGAIASLNKANTAAITRLIAQLAADLQSPKR